MHDIQQFVIKMSQVHTDIERAAMAFQIDVANLVHRQTVVNIDTMLDKHRDWNSGRLRQSVSVEGKDLEGNVVVSIGNNLTPYAYMQEYGSDGYIKPVRAKWLTIPTSKDTTRRTARDYQKTSVRFIGHGYGQILDSQGELLYHLVKRVKIPATGYASKAVEMVETSGEWKLAAERRFREATGE